MEWDIYAYELAREFLKYLSAEFLAFLKEEMGMPNALQVDEFASGVVDTAGVPLAGGLVYTYAAGTTTDKSIYTDAAMTTAETNPMVLDAAGCKNVYAYGNYKFVVKTSAGVTVRTLDNQYYMVPSTTAEVVNSIAYADTPYSATAANQLIKANTAGGNITITLPTAVGNEGVEIRVVKTHADNTLSIDQTGTETTNGSTSATTLTDVYGLLGFTSDNTNWVISQNVPTGTVTASSTTTLTNKTLTSPVLGGTITGTYTLAGTPTINTPTITTDSWTNVTGGIGYNSDWADEATFAVSFMKDPMGFIHMKGVAKKGAGAGAQLIFTLGASYRPATHDRYFLAGLVDATGHSVAVIIGTDGQVVLNSTGAEGDRAYFDSIPPFK